MQVKLVSVLKRNFTILTATGAHGPSPSKTWILDLDNVRKKSFDFFQINITHRSVNSCLRMILIKFVEKMKI